MQGDFLGVAKEYARKAYEEHFDRRQGVFLPMDDEGKNFLPYVVYYNNQTYTGYPGLREAELAEFRLGLHINGMEVLAVATYPEDSQTLAVVIATAYGHGPQVVHLAADASKRCWRRWPKDGGEHFDEQPGQQRADARRVAERV